MTKSIAEDIRTIMDRLNEVAHSYDFTIDVENWEEPETEDDPNWPYERTLGVDYRIVGQHRPATWGYHGGEPPEYPEIDEFTVYDAATGQKLDFLPDHIEDEIVRAIWKNAEQSRDDYDPPYERDDYDRY